MQRLILGTAGHIDHGKTTLVRALTGVDTDRLPEEKRRGITVDLGFAPLDLADGTQFGVVDVPGHEAFIRNMLAGASGVDVALLVVAADEGVMPQTREHVAILSLLDVRALVVALTKVDLIDDDWLELVDDDVRSMLEHSPWPDAAVLPVAGTTGAGLDELRAALATAAGRVRARRRDDLFRMPVDRVFTVHGTGTIATGTTWSGRVRRDAQLRLLPADTKVRVRDVQRHGESAGEAGAGERTALALAGTDRDRVSRGDVLVQGAEWMAGRILTVLLTVLPDAARALVPGRRVRVHLGTAEAMARVTLLGRAELGAGDSAWAQLRLESALIARSRDRVIVRSYSPVTTIGGGIVAEPAAPRRGRLSDHDAGRLRDVITGSTAAAITACATLDPWQGAPYAALPIVTGLVPADIEAALPGVADVHVAATRVFGRSVLDEAATRVDTALGTWHERHPLEAGCEREVLRRALPAHGHPELLHVALDQLAARGTIAVQGALYARAGWQPHVSARHAALLDGARAVYREAGLAAPHASELPQDLVAHPDLSAALRLLAREGAVTEIEPGRWVWTATLHHAVAAARDALGDREAIGPGDFRDVWAVTRKHLIPLLEYLDRTGVTERVGDARRFVTPPRGAQV